MTKKKPVVETKPATGIKTYGDKTPLPTVTAFLADGSKLAIPYAADPIDPPLSAREAAERVFRNGLLELGTEEGIDFYPLSSIRRIEVRL